MPACPSMHIPRYAPVYARPPTRPATLALSPFCVLPHAHARARQPASALLCRACSSPRRSIAMLAPCAGHACLVRAPIRPGEALLAPLTSLFLPAPVRHRPSPLPTPVPPTSLCARVLARALPVVLKPVTAAPPLPQPADHYRQPQSHGYALEPMHGAPATAREPNTPLAPLPALDPHLRHAHGHPHAYSQPAGLRGSQPTIPPDSAPGAGIHIACESGRAVANAASTRKPRAVRVREREQQLQREMSSATAD
ncbi:hypothetical protein FRC08_001669 [Ceratobasidium sp. 394]|nr:hypothetical protein FRC08_001669 [Ceratobasidium sp. 394]